jgi:short-subunit dehydrogenase
MTLRPATPADGVVWITGASSGIGRAVALEHARRGWTVAATARREDELVALADAAGSLPGRIVAHPGDVTDTPGMAAVAMAIGRAHGPIARAILNAGVFHPVRARTFDRDIYEKSFSINVMGVVNGLAAIMPAMAERGTGQIAITASVAGYGGLPSASAYGATKAALINLAAGLKFDLDQAGVLIQIVCPGFVRTAATDQNAFPMPFLMEAEDAARRFVHGLDTTRFEIAFPRRFALILKLANLLPYSLYFATVGRATGWDRREDPA